MKDSKKPGPLPVNVQEAIEAIATTGKGRCWYCDARLPAAERAISDGWDVQRIEEQPVASIIVVCPECLDRESDLIHVRADAGASGGNGRHALTLEPKRA